jgi:hypothetical protein
MPVAMGGMGKGARMYQSGGDGYQSEGRLPARTVLVVFGTLALLVVVGGLATVALNYVRDRNSIAAAFAEVETNPGTREMFQVLKVEFPADYASLKREIERVAFETRDAAAVGRAAQAWTVKFRLDNFDMVMRHDRATLRNIFNLTGAANEALAAHDVRECANLAMGRPLMLPRGTDPAVMQALSASGAAIFRAIKAGRTLPARPQPVLSEGDSAAFVKALHATTSPRLFNAIVAPDLLASLPPDEQCQANLAIHDAVSTMPEPAASTIAAFILFEAAKAERAVSGR